MKKYLLFILLISLLSISTQAENSISEMDLTRVEINEIKYKTDKPNNNHVEIKIIPDNTDIINEVKPVHTVTVNYIDIMGNVISEPQKVYARTGDIISIDSPDAVNFISLSSVEETIPDRDVEYTMLYLPAEFFLDNTGKQIWIIEGKNKIVNVITIDSYETPLNLGNIVMNVGISCE